MGHREHRRAAPRRVPTAVLTISDTRTLETDAAGPLIRRLLAKAGHPVVDARILRDDPRSIVALLRQWGRDGRIRAMILTGGTGVSPRDGTFEAVDSLLEKRLEGFGEIFRMLSYDQVGAAAFLSRAAAGIYRGRAVFSLPGSVPAVRLGMQKLILPELAHLAYEIAKPARRRPKIR